MTSEEQESEYHQLYLKVMKDLSTISQMRPRERYMYRLMNTVIFQDFETALDAMIEDFQIANDNQK